MFLLRAQSVPEGQTNAKTVGCSVADAGHLEHLRNSRGSRVLIVLGVVPSSISAYICLSLPPRVISACT